ncbi:hypothetical protein L9F63_014605 [Diploptera punctata]|uniref:Lysosomal Pro-X carboxypeptidase n=1 Tax=Diploptera punctata TaxID=6984 RepID=A0AAD8A7M8_DIPPU|nr:hypothetical protein L9F63_014605 [Diploptera punctata]
MMMISSVLVIMCIALCAGAEQYTYHTKYLDMPVDHFSFATNHTFKLRYLVNDTFFQEHTGSPIFFYTGNEGDIEMFAQNTGFMFDAAPEFGALLVFAEHRYYGKTLPFGNKSYDLNNVGYLTSQQALADFVVLIRHLQQNQDRPSPVIAFGGSYGGMLSAYLRMKYPNVVIGAIAASAPIFQFTGLIPCEAFNRIATSDYRSASPACASSIRKSWAHLNNMSSTDAGRKWLNENWKLCKPLNKSSDINELKDWLQNVYTSLAMIDYPYPTNFLCQCMPPTRSQNIKYEVMCQQLYNSSMTDKVLLKSLFKAVNVYFNYTGSANCLDIESSATQNLGDLGWSYQSCTEMVMPMCTDGVNDMFEPSVWDFAKFSEECYDTWKLSQILIAPSSCMEGRTYPLLPTLSSAMDFWTRGQVVEFCPVSPPPHMQLSYQKGLTTWTCVGRILTTQCLSKRQDFFHKNRIRAWIRNFHLLPPTTN